jgi:hypothetical protein
MKKRHLSQLLAASAAALPLALAHAQLIPGNINIDPDGGGTDSTISVQALDWSQTSVLSLDNIPLSVGDTFTSLTQAVLGNFQNPSGVSIGGTGLNSAYDWTVTMAFAETVTALTDPNGVGFNTHAEFVTDPTAPSALTIYYDTTRNVDPLAGTGFNDGTPILTATLSNAASGDFDVDAGSVPDAGGTTEDLDQNGTDDWLGQQTLTGRGSTTNVAFSVQTVDNAFFPDVFVGDILNLSLLYGNVDEQLPFNQVDPAQQVWNDLTDAFAAADGTLGEVNALDGPNSLFQTDYNNTFLVERATNPEPGTLALLGIGLAAFGGRSLRRRAKATA